MRKNSSINVQKATYNLPKKNLKKITLILIAKKNNVFFCIIGKLSILPHMWLP